MLIFKCGWYDLLNSIMISIRRIFFYDVEDILFQMSSHCFPLSSLFLPMSLLMWRINSIWRIFYSKCPPCFFHCSPLSSLFLPMSLLMRRINSIWRIFLFLMSSPVSFIVLICPHLSSLFIIWRIFYF